MLINRPLVTVFSVFVSLFLTSSYIYALDTDNSSKPAISENEMSLLYLKVVNLEAEGKYEEAIKILDEMLKVTENSTFYEKYIYMLIYLNDIDKSLEMSLKANKLYPDDIIFIKFLAQIYEFKEDYAKSVKYLDALIQKSDTNIDYVFIKASILVKMGQKTTALKEFNKLINMGNSKSEYYVNRGNLHQDMGNIKLAIDDYRSAVDIDRNMLALLRLSDIYLKENNKEESKKYLEMIVGSNETMVLPEIKLGEIYLEDKDYQKAIELYQNFAKKMEGKDKISVLKYLGNIQVSMGDYDNASITFEEILMLAPEDTLNYYSAGYLNELAEKNDKALAIYNDALKLQPNFASIIKRVSVIYLLDNKSEKSIEVLANIDEIERDVDYYRLLAESYLQEDESKQAVIILNEGLKSNPTSDEIFYSLAIAYDKLDKREDSIVNIKKANELSPNNPIYQNFLGYMYVLNEINLDEAIKLITSALDKDPDNAAYLDSLGWAYFMKKKYKKAYSYIERAAELAPDEKEIVDHLEEIKKKLKIK